MPRSIKPPAYRKRNLPQGERAYLTLRDSATGRTKDYNLGAYGSDESRERHARLVADWEARGRRLAGERTPTNSLTVTQLCAEYRRAVKGERSSKEVSAVGQVIRVLRSLYGTTAAAEFGPNALREVRQAMIDGDPDAAPRPRPAWARKTVAGQVHRIGAMFKWASAHELLSITVYQALKSLEPMRPGTVKDGEPVGPAAAAYIDVVRERVSRQARAMIDLQLTTGMRPGELVAMRACDVDMSGHVWLYQPTQHKTAHHGKSRTIYLGPRAQRTIRPFLKRSTVAPLFSPAEADAERRELLSKKRKTPTSCGNRPGTNRSENPQRKPGDCYTTDSYRRAIVRACKAAGVPTWHPHQLRHNYATDVRRQYGLEAAQILLGHSSALITDAVYAERDMDRAQEIVAKIG